MLNEAEQMQLREKAAQVVLGLDEDHQRRVLERPADQLAAMVARWHRLDAILPEATSERSLLESHAQGLRARIRDAEKEAARIEAEFVSGEPMRARSGRSKGKVLTAKGRTQRLRRLLSLRERLPVQRAELVAVQERVRQLAANPGFEDLARKTAENSTEVLRALE